MEMIELNGYFVRLDAIEAFHNKDDYLLTVYTKTNKYKIPDEGDFWYNKLKQAVKNER